MKPSFSSLKLGMFRLSTLQIERDMKGFREDLKLGNPSQLGFSKLGNVSGKPGNFPKKVGNKKHWLGQDWTNLEGDIN